MSFLVFRGSIFPKGPFINLSLWDHSLKTRELLKPSTIGKETVISLLSKYLINTSGETSLWTGWYKLAVLKLG